MRLLATLILVLTLAACGESPEAIAEREAAIKKNISEITEESYGAVVYIEDSKLVLTFPERPDTFASYARAVALAASNAAPSKMFTLYVLDGDKAATSIPEKSVCSVSASDNRIQGNNC